MSISLVHHSSFTGTNGTTLTAVTPDVGAALVKDAAASAMALDGSGNAAGNLGMYYAPDAPGTADYSLEWTIPGTVYSTLLGWVRRTSSDPTAAGGNGYRIQVSTAAGGRIILYRYVNGVQVHAGQFDMSTPPSGVRFRAKVATNGASVDFTFYRAALTGSFTQIGTLSDIDATRITAAGFGGFDTLNGFPVADFKVFTGEDDPPLVAPTASLTSASSTTITVARTAATGGSGSYTYDLHRSTSAGFTPSGGTLIAAGVGTSYADSTGLTAGQLYTYIFVVSDGSATGTSNDVYAGLSLPTAPIAGLPLQGTQSVVLAYIGSSTWIEDLGAGNVPDAIEDLIIADHSSANITTLNAAFGGLSSGDYTPSNPNDRFDDLMALIDAETGYKVLRLMIGSNDTVPATWAVNMQAIVDGAASHVDLIVLETIGFRVEVGATSVNNMASMNALRSSITGAKIVLGTANTLVNQANTRLTTLDPDNIHQNQIGLDNLAADQYAELTGVYGASEGAIGRFYVFAPGDLMIGSMITTRDRGFGPA